MDLKWYFKPLRPSVILIEGVNMNKIHKCKITVLKRTLNQDFVERFLESEYCNISLCECFEEGQEFEVDLSQLPNDFEKNCPHAWLDICKDVSMIAYGANIPGYREKGTIISSCTDWFRPVLFKIERV